MRFLLLTFLTAAFTFNVLSQTSGGTAPAGANGWVRLAGPNQDVTIDVPSRELVVDKTDYQTRVFYTDRRVYIGLDQAISQAKQKDLVRNLKGRLKSYYKDTGRKISVIDRGEYVVGEYNNTDEKTGIKTVELTIMSVHGTYIITVRSVQGREEERDRILSSIRLGDKPLYQGVGEPLDGAETVLVSSLKTSDEIKDVLNKPDSSQKNLTWIKLSSDTMPAEQYLRPFVVLRKPRPSYPENARRDNISGTVHLLVTFRSDGTVGDIQCYDTLSRDLGKEAFEAAKKIKFLPAELDGKPVDSEGIVPYTFTIY